MATEEERMKAAKQFTSNGDMRYGFIKGAEWAESQNDWIPCGERLPEEEGWYLVICNGEKHPFSNYFTKEKLWNNLCRITHWMPIPPAPSK